MPQQEIIKLELLEIQQDGPTDGATDIRLQTNNGTIPGRYHAASSGAAAVLWVIDGPAGSIYERLAARLAPDNIASLQLGFRVPGNLIDCVLDVLLGIGFLRNQGHRRIALVGHAFGAAVAINAGVASPAVVAVAALSPQMTGADDIAELRPRPVLLMHGTSDQVLSDVCSRELFGLAAEPKELLLYEGCSHNFDECRDQVDRDLLEWLRRVTPGEL